MLKVGIVGWRGMVGSVMLKRMMEENDFDGIEPFFFSTSQFGKKAPDVGVGFQIIRNAYDTNLLSNMNIIVSCQGSKYTKYMYKILRNNPWKGYWIDTASELRLKSNTIIALDPINRENINQALSDGILDYIGGNCTVSLMLMALHGIVKNNWIEWINSSTYQSVSGAGIDKVKEFILQIKSIGHSIDPLLNNSSSKILEIEQQITNKMHTSSFPTQNFGIPILGNLIPWIDEAMENGQTREEWKGLSETNKILGLSRNRTIFVDGQCVRIPTIRCHSQSLTIKLKKNIPMEKIAKAISSSNKWVRLIANNKEDTIKELNPFSVSGSLRIPIGRLRKLNIGPKYLTAFTVGDQLLWGAAEPIRRMLNIVIEFIS